MLAFWQVVKKNNARERSSFWTIHNHEVRAETHEAGVIMRMSSHSREIPARFLLAKAASGEIISLFCRGSVFLQKRTWRFPCTSTVQIKTAYLYCTRTVRIAKRCTTVVRVRVAQEMHAQLHTCHVNYDSCHTLLFPELRKYGSTKVLPYESMEVRKYFRTSVPS